MVRSHINPNVYEKMPASKPLPQRKGQSATIPQGGGKTANRKTISRTRELPQTKGKATICRTVGCDNETGNPYLSYCSSCEGNRKRLASGKTKKESEDSKKAIKGRNQESLAVKSSRRIRAGPRTEEASHEGLPSSP